MLVRQFLTQRAAAASMSLSRPFRTVVAKRWMGAAAAASKDVTAVKDAETGLKVAFLGSGNWGSAAAWLASQNCLRHDTFADDINMFVFEETVDGASTEEVNNAWKVVAKHISDERGLDNVGIQLLAAEVGVALSRAEAKAAIREMDLNDDSRVTYDEFLAWWNGSGKSNVGRLLSSVSLVSGKARDDPNRKRKEAHETFLARARRRRCAPPTARVGQVINSQHENTQYLPGVKLGINVHAHGNMEAAVAGADLLVFVTPHQFVKEQAQQLREQGVIKDGAIAISLIKGMEITPTGFELISEVISRELGGVETSVLMGANIASEVADGKFSEATVGAVNDRHARLWRQLFHTDTFHVETTCDLPAVEMCGALVWLWLRWVALGCAGLRWVALGWSRLTSSHLVPIYANSTTPPPTATHAHTRTHPNTHTPNPQARSRTSSRSAPASATAWTQETTPRRRSCAWALRRCSA